VGTTKLTRKEILAEDPVHETIVGLIDLFRENGKMIGIIAAIVVLVAIGIYGGLQYLDSREMQAQEELGKGMEFFHAEISADAADDPFGKGATPMFKTDSAKYQAASREFSSVIEHHGYSKVSIIARYYLALCQLQMGKNKEAVQNLESVASNSRVRTVGFLAKRVLAAHYADSGNNKGAAEILDGMLKDSRCQLPREELSVQLAKVMVAQGKRDEAIKLLRDASSQGPEFSVFKQQLMTELDKLQKMPATASQPTADRP
jgi:predicted negative regulator of RcsB-dependent stress response